MIYNDILWWSLKRETLRSISGPVPHQDHWLEEVSSFSFLRRYCNHGCLQGAFGRWLDEFFVVEWPWKVDLGAKKCFADDMIVIFIYIYIVYIIYWYVYIYTHHMCIHLFFGRNGYGPVEQNDFSQCWVFGERDLLNSVDHSSGPGSGWLQHGRYPRDFLGIMAII